MFSLLRDNLEMGPDALEGLPHAQKVWLLFPFVTNQQGWDTGLAVSNISLDPLGTPLTEGDLILHFYGAFPPPSAIPRGKVAAGVTDTCLASIIAPVFQGYVVAECNFYPARGFALIFERGNTATIASTYQAEILRVDPVVARHI